jgi:hypothetical protein
VTLNEAELAKIKADWEESQRKKKEKEQAAKDKEKEKEKEKESTSAASTAASWIGWATGIGSSNTANPGTASTSTSSTEATPKKTPNSPNSLFASPNGTPTHQRFILNRQIFLMRQSQFRKKRNIAQVNLVAPRLPIVPGNLY